MAETRSTDDSADGTDKPAVTAHSCSEHRTVFTESGNADAWIATDLTVELTQ